MKFLSFFFLLFFSCISCQRNTVVYYNDTEDYDDAEIWGTTDLHLFFNNDLGLSKYKVTSKKVYKELYKIKNKLTDQGNNIDWDDHFYEYAFVLNEKDTLYANLSQQVWRYRKRKLELECTIEYLLNESGVPHQK